MGVQGASTRREDAQEVRAPRCFPLSSDSLQFIETDASVM